MNKQQDSSMSPLFIMAVVFFILIGLVSMIQDGTSSSSSKSLDQLQQERFEYEADRDRVQQQMQTRETINKIQSGYYD